MGTPVPARFPGAYKDALGAPWCRILDLTPAATLELLETLRGGTWWPPATSMLARILAWRCWTSMRGSSYWARSHQTVAFCFRMRATYEEGELPEREDEERRRAPLLERFGVPVVEEVEEVALERVRRVPWPGGGGYWVGYCEAGIVPGGMYAVAGGRAVDADAEADAMGKMPDDVVRVREWPWASDSGFRWG